MVPFVIAAISPLPVQRVDLGVFPSPVTDATDIDRLASPPRRSSFFWPNRSRMKTGRHSRWVAVSPNTDRTRRDRLDSLRFSDGPNGMTKFARKSTKPGLTKKLSPESCVASIRAEKTLQSANPNYQATMSRDQPWLWLFPSKKILNGSIRRAVSRGNLAGTAVLRGQGSAKVIVSNTVASRLKCRARGDSVLRS